ncbi:hypothetical protein AKJ16_DCAP15898 [Drosera capensis]
MAWTVLDLSPRPRMSLLVAHLFVHTILVKNHFLSIRLGEVYQEANGLVEEKNSVTVKEHAMLFADRVNTVVSRGLVFQKLERNELVLVVISLFSVNRHVTKNDYIVEGISHLFEEREDSGCYSIGYRRQWLLSSTVYRLLSTVVGVADCLHCEFINFIGKGGGQWFMIGCGAYGIYDVCKSL